MGTSSNKSILKIYEIFESQKYAQNSLEVLKAFFTLYNCRLLLEPYEKFDCNKGGRVYGKCIYKLLSDDLIERIRTLHKDTKKLQVIGDELISNIINSEKEFLIESRKLII